MNCANCGHSQENHIEQRGLCLVMPAYPSKDLCSCQEFMEKKLKGCAMKVRDLINHLNTVTDVGKDTALIIRVRQSGMPDRFITAEFVDHPVADYVDGVLLYATQVTL